MIIHSYVMTCPDEADVLSGCLDSLSNVSDRIFIVDGGLGGGSLIHRARYTERISEWIQKQSNFGRECCPGTETWGGIPITLWENQFLDPGNQRNFIMSAMMHWPEQPDWILWIDSDEILSHQFSLSVRDFLSRLPDSVTNVCPKWLTLVQDESHCVPHMSNWLAHGRLYRPGSIYWNSGWHENQYYEGQRVQFDVRVLHLRALFRRRLWIQRGHPQVAGRDNPLWGDARIESVPSGVTWDKIRWPDGEVEIPFDADIRDYMEGKYA